MSTSTTADRSRPRRGEGAAGGRPPIRWRTAAAFLAPAFALYTLFMIYPLVSALQYSLFEWRGTAQGPFVGLGNFAELFTRFPLNRNLARAFGHNAAFFVGTMAIQNTLGLLFAVLLHRSRAGKRFLRVAFTMPFLLSPLVVGYLWSLILNPTFGPVNAALRTVGLDALALPWLGDPSTALPTVILVNAWQWVGFPMMLFGAGLAAISDDYTEAAFVDGANSWQAFWRVTFPLLTPVVGTVSVLTFIGNFNIFGLVYAMGGSQGGPAGATDVLGLLFYRTAFQGGTDAIGVASALAVVMFAFIFGMSLLAVRVLRRYERRLA